MGRPVAIAALAAVLVSTVACGGASSDGTATSRPPTSAPGSSSPGSTATASPTSSPSPSVTPAVGTTYGTDGFSFILPDGFTPAGTVGQGSGILTNTSFQDLGRGVQVFVSTVPNLPGYDLEQSAQLGAKTSMPGSRQANREVGGEQVYVFDDPAAGAFTRNYQVGRPTRAGTIVSISINLVRGVAGQEPVDPADDQAFIDSVLATVVWKA